MAVQFIFGGSGRGKTYFLQHKIMEEAVNNPKKDYIMIVPEQFTMQTQKDMIKIILLKIFFLIIFFLLIFITVQRNFILTRVSEEAYFLYLRKMMIIMR